MYTVERFIHNIVFDLPPHVLVTAFAVTFFKLSFHALLTALFMYHLLCTNVYAKIICLPSFGSGKR